MRRLAALALALASCTSTPPDPNPGNFAIAANGWYRGDLHFHTNYSEDALRQGGDDLPAALAIADAYRDPAYVSAHPEYTGDGLDFVAVTDHRTDVGIKSAEFKHDHLILLPGEEYGGSGHASIWGLRDHITNDAAEGQTQDERHKASMAEAHAQGALFSINHPCQSTRWPWTVTDVDGVEVWNAPWSAFWGESSLEDLDADRVGGKPENPFIRAAIAARGGGSNHQALMLWYGMLSRGLHPAAVGGGDRHMIVMPGLPTTYVKRTAAFAGKTGQALGVDGVLAGIRERRTVVSSSPHGPQVELSAVHAKDGTYELGARLKAGQTYAITARVTRAKGGVVRFVGGPLLPGDGPVTPEPTVLSEQAIDGGDVQRHYTWVVPAGGGWLHVIVLVPRLDEPMPEELAGVKEIFDVLPEGKDLGALLPAFGKIVDGDTLVEPNRCDPANWQPYLGQCVPADKVSFETYYLPDPVLRLANTWFEGGVPTKWSMGALTSAFLATP